MSEENYQNLRLKARDPRHPCPTCEMVMGYCGGGNHPSCGLFEDGKPVSLASHLDIFKKQKKRRAQMLNETTVSIRAGNKPEDGVGDRMLEFKAPWSVEELKKTPHELLAQTIFDRMMNGVTSEQQSIAFIASLLRLTEKELDEFKEDDKAFEEDDKAFIEAYRLGGMDALAAVDIEEAKALEIVDSCVEGFINGSEDDTRYY